MREKGSHGRALICFPFWKVTLLLGRGINWGRWGKDRNRKTIRAGFLFCFCFCFFANPGEGLLWFGLGWSNTVSQKWSDSEISLKAELSSFAGGSDVGW